MNPLRVDKKGPVRPGHAKRLAELGDVDAYRATRARYRAALGEHGVYLRLTDPGFTVISLDHERCGSMVGVGGRGTTDHSVRLPVSEVAVASAVAGYHDKVASLVRDSAEERYALQVIESALEGDLSLPLNGVYFIHQEWRLSSQRRIDLLGVDPAQRRLVVVELKDSEAEARRQDAGKGGDAWDQARSYAETLYAERESFYGFFERLAQAMARCHDAPPVVREVDLDLEKAPAVYAAWPDGGWR